MGTILQFKAPAEPEAPNVLDLPFVKDTPDGRRFWCVEPTGDTRQDNETGRRYAEMALNYAVKSGNGPTIGWIIDDMPQKRGGVEIGFMAEVTKQALSHYRMVKMLD